MRRAILSTDRDDRADAGEDDAQGGGEPPATAERLVQRLAGVARPADEQPDHGGDTDDEVDVALESELVGHDERHEERDGHATGEPGQVSAS